MSTIENIVSFHNGSDNDSSDSKNNLNDYVAVLSSTLVSNEENNR